jgi:hypothetical protein
MEHEKEKEGGYEFPLFPLRVSPNDSRPPNKLCFLKFLPPRNSAMGWGPSFEQMEFFGEGCSLNQNYRILHLMDKHSNSSCHSYNAKCIKSPKVPKMLTVLALLKSPRSKSLLKSSTTQLLALVK